MMRLLLGILLSLSASQVVRAQAEGPPPPSQKVQHPEASKGLIKIDKERNYIYEVPSPKRTSSASFRYSTLSAPKIENETTTLSYTDIYGESNLGVVNFEFEYNPFEWTNNLGGLISFGLATTNGNGRFKKSLANESIEKFTLYVIPVSFSAQYRFEYLERQWFSPYITLGLTGILAAETRDDGKKVNTIGAPAINGGGGLLVSISSWDREGSFSLMSEYGITHLWLNFDFKMLQSLSSKNDFSSPMVGAGITMDY